MDDEVALELEEPKPPITMRQILVGLAVLGLVLLLWAGLWWIAVYASPLPTNF
jgi:hypothetical protein